MPKLTAAFLLYLAGTITAQAGPFSNLCAEDGGTDAQCSCFEREVQGALNADEQELLVGMMRQDANAIARMAQSEDMMERMESVMDGVAATCS
jgi:hypothetical protein